MLIKGVEWWVEVNLVGDVCFVLSESVRFFSSARNLNNRGGDR